MVQMAAEYLTKEHATLLPLDDTHSDAPELPILDTLSRAQYYKTLYQDLLKEKVLTPEEAQERASVEEADEEAASHFQARCEQDEVLQNKEHTLRYPTAQPTEQNLQVSIAPIAFRNPLQSIPISIHCIPTVSLQSIPTGIH